MALLLISLNFHRIITCLKKKSLWIHKLLSAQFSPSLLLIPERADLDNSPENLLHLTAETLIVPIRSYIHSNTYVVFVLSTKTVSVLTECENQVSVWINLQTTTNTLCFLEVIRVFVHVCT